MGFLGFGKKRTIDFTNSEVPHQIVKKDYPMSGDFVYFRSEKKEHSYSKQPQTISKSPFDFLAEGSNPGSYQSTSSSNPTADVSEISELKTKLRNMTVRIEDQSNEMYRLVQRIELLERKLERYEGRS